MTPKCKVTAGQTVYHSIYTWFKSADNLFYTAGTVTATAQIIYI